ncbi:DUF6070 family protein [Faecalicatena orotica]|uniref:DUF6070 family protein n=1 Tax=Faecalicatena orotica TaxID=1544 RepID=UPI0032177F81
MRLRRIFIFIIVLLMGITGCAAADSEPAGDVHRADENKQDSEAAIHKDSEKIAEGYREIYEQAYQEDNISSLEVKEKIIASLGDKGYTAVDMGNQIDMVNPGQAEAFCKSVGNKEEDQATILIIGNDGGFVRYDLRTKDGEVKVLRSSLFWKDGLPSAEFYERFTAHTWKYTKEGYIFIEQYHMPGYDGAPGITAIRVKPLDRSLRELNRQYVMPLGYERNNLLITDWSASDYGVLDFYDLYEEMYKLKYGDYVPYESGYGGEEYEVPEKEFEEVIQTYIGIDSTFLREKTMYQRVNKTYLYRPRGMHDAETPYEPEPEVTACEEQEDGTLKLAVNAVWQMEMQSCAFTSELVVRPLENGAFQYVSNRVVPLPDSNGAVWYTPRLSQEEWTAFYRNTQ